MKRSAPVLADTETVPVFMPATLLALAGEFKVSPAKLLTGTGLKAEYLAHPESRISCDQFRRMMLNAIEMIDESALGLVFGERIRLSRLGVLGYALMSAASLRQAMNVAARYQRTLGSGLELIPCVLAPRGNQPARVELVARKTALTDTLRTFTLECWLTGIVRTIIELRESRVPGLAVEFDYPAPPYADRYEALLGAPVRFGASSCRVIFDAAIIDDALPGSSPAAHANAIALCEGWLAESGAAVALVDEVKSILLRDPSNMPDAEAVARQLNISRRTLQRRLAGHEMNFRELVQRTRRELACDYLRNTNRPLTDIARMLGFFDTANFSRAFSQWIGETPMEYRRRCCA